MAATIPPGLEDALSIDPEIMHGTLCFKGTRLPLTVLLDNLTDGVGVDEFIEDCPSASRGQVLVVLDWQAQQLRQIANLSAED